MVKLLKDCMTKCGYWLDDSQVYDERVIKEWSMDPGVVIGIWDEEREKDGN